MTTTVLFCTSTRSPHAIWLIFTRLGYFEGLRDKSLSACAASISLGSGPQSGSDSTSSSLRETNISPVSSAGGAFRFLVGENRRYDI